MTASIEHHPGDPAPASDDYEELTLFGHPAGRVCALRRVASHGGLLLSIPLPSCENGEPIIAAWPKRAEPQIMDSLRKLAERFDAVADRRQDAGRAASAS